DFAAMRRALFAAGDEARAAWRNLLDKHRITHLIVDDADDEELTIGLGRLFGSRLWTLHYLHGRTTVFGTAALALPAVDSLQPAWRPSPEKRAPESWPGRDPQPRGWLDAFERRAAAFDPGRDECLVWQAHFDAQRDSYAQRMRRQ